MKHPYLISVPLISIRTDIGSAIVIALLLWPLRRLTG